MVEAVRQRSSARGFVQSFLQPLVGMGRHLTSVALMHAVEVIQPLLILPYAGRVLGAKNFGQFSYALSVGFLALVIVGFGYHWTGQREAAAARRDPDAIASLYADIAVTRGILFLLVTAIGVYSAGRWLGISKTMFLCVMLIALGHVLTPSWLLLALERAWQAAVAVITARVLALGCFFAMVRSPQQLELAVAIQASVPLVAAVISLPFVLPVIGIDGFRSITPSRILARVQGGWRGFLFTAVDGAVVALPVPLVTHFSGYVAAGEYSVADKFITATRPFSRAMVESFLPRVAYYAKHDPPAGVRLIWRSLSTVGGSIVFALGLYLLAPFVIIHLFGNQFSGAVPIVRVMAILPVLMNINTCTSSLYMFSCGHERAWSYLNISGLLAFFAVAYFLAPVLPEPAIGIVIAVIARETVVLFVSVGFFVGFGAKRNASPFAVRALDHVGEPQHESPQ